MLNTSMLGLLAVVRARAGHIERMASYQLDTQPCGHGIALSLDDIKELREDLGHVECALMDLECELEHELEQAES